MALKFSFHSGKEYFNELVTRLDASGPKSRVLIITMNFDPTAPEISRVSDSLLAAAKRGANISLGVDAHSLMFQDSKFGPLWFNTVLPKKADALKALDAIYSEQISVFKQIDKSSHSRVHITNTPSARHSLPVAGRSHIKLAVFDDFVLVPCANLDHPEFINIAISFRHKRTADWLYKTLTGAINSPTIREGLQFKDLSHTIDDTARIIIDCGLQNKSPIYDEALALIDRAEKWLTITCQYFPGGPTAKHLRAAHTRGVDVKILYSPPAQHSGIVRLGSYAYNTRERMRMPASMFKNPVDPKLPRMHAKLLACDKGLMIGSHNYVDMGVRLGTAEIALCSTDSEAAQKSVDALGI